MTCITAWNLSSVRLWMVTDVFTVCKGVTGSISRAQYTTGAEYFDLL